MAQPADLADVLLHETAVSHVQERLRVNRPRKPWLETRAEFGKRRRAHSTFRIIKREVSPSLEKRTSPHS